MNDAVAGDTPHFPLDKLPTTGYTGSVWRSVEERRGREPVGRLVSRPVIQRGGQRFMPLPATTGGVGMGPRELGKRSLCRPLPSVVNCHAAAGRRSSGDRGAKKEFFFLHGRCANVYENKGPLCKKCDLSGNVYENKGSYSQKAGMYMKIQQLALGVTMTPRELGKRSLRRPLPSVLTGHAASGRLSTGDRAAKREFFFLHGRCENVYENKGPLWKNRRLSRNVYENKGSYSLKAGMYMKTRKLIIPRRLDGSTVAPVARLWRHGHFAPYVGWSHRGRL